MIIYNSKLLDIDAEIYNDSLKLNANGFLSPIANPILNKINNIFEDEKPIKIEENKVIFSSWVPPIPSIPFNRMIQAHIENTIFNKKIPDQISISVTSKCPNNCIHCGASDFMNNKEEDMSIENINTIINSGTDLGTYLVTIDGGEPLFRKDICDVIHNISKSELIVSMFTSGYGLNQINSKILKKCGLYSIKISLDSTNEKKHDYIRGRKGSYKDVINAIKLSKNSNILTDLYITISPYNIDELEDFYSFGIENNVDEISMTGIIAVGKWKENENDVITKNDIKRIEQFHKEKNKKNEGPRITAMPYLLGKKMFGCFAGRRWMHISNNGDVLPCPYTPIKFGNIKEESLKKIWDNMTNSEIYKNPFQECRMRNKKFRSSYINFHQ